MVMIFWVLRWTANSFINIITNNILVNIFDIVIASIFITKNTQWLTKRNNNGKLVAYGHGRSWDRYPFYRILVFREHTWKHTTHADPDDKAAAGHIIIYYYILCLIRRYLRKNTHVCTIICILYDRV